MLAELIKCTGLGCVAGCFFDMYGGVRYNSGSAILEVIWRVIVR